MLDHLRPQYANAFRCIGAECEDSCCHGFDIPIDKATYRKYESITGFAPLLQTHFELITRNATEAFHARIKLNTSFSCPFFAADRLCSIQKEHGEEYLSEACSSYPRATRRIDGRLESALYLSCPEAARLVLLEPTLLQPDRDVTRSRSLYDRFAGSGQQAETANGAPHQYLWELRSFTLLLIRDRSYPLWERLFILGMLCKRLNEIFSVRQNGLVPNLLRDFAGIVVQNKLRPLMDGIPAQTTPQLTLVMAVIHRILAIQVNDPSHARFCECVEDFLLGIRYDPGAPIESCAPFYAEGHTSYYEPFMQKHPFIMENYLVNHVVRTRFPFGVNSEGKPNDPLTESLLMNFQYAAIKGLLIGMAGHYREEFGAAHVVKLVQSFSKAVEHCPKILAAIHPDMSSVNGMAMMLKT